MPGRTIMDTARKCVDMTRLDRVWKAWEMTMTEIYALSLINYHLDGEGEVFIDDNGAVEVETADEHAVFYMDLQDRKSTRLNSSHVAISYAVFCLKKKK